MRLAVLLVVAFTACGSITVADDVGDTSPAADRDAGAPELAAARPDAPEVRDAAAECPPTALSCGSERGACGQGQIVAKRSECGGAPFPVCCPVNDCELAACELCTGCP